MNELREFYSAYETTITDSNSALEFHKTVHTPRDLIPLSEFGYQEYMKKYQDLIHSTQKVLSAENLENKTVIRPYLAFNMILPIKELIEFKKKHSN